jgi:alpha-ketoglutaric semialdehyde dehydrogenase
MATLVEHRVQHAQARNFIGGEWVQSKGPRRQERRNPANHDDVVGVVTLSTRDEAQQAIAAAAAAFPMWRATPAPIRGRAIATAAQIMSERQQELGRLLTREEGKTLAESAGEIQRSINILEYMAGEARRIGGETLPSELPKNFAYTIRQPLGVVACITPWNFPVAIPVWKIAPALVAGNTVVFKPATLTAFTAMMVIEIFQQAGVPGGVLNLVIGSGNDVGDELLENPAVKAVSFTGSNEVGASIYAKGAKRMIKVQCEMGGKNPVVVLRDADLNLAVEGTLQGAFGSTGQRCTATSRVIVEESIADEFVRLLIERSSQLKVGDGSQGDVKVGPSVDDAQFNTVLKYLNIGKQEGATLACGGDRLRGVEYDKGLFVAPTIFDHVKPHMRIAQEEIFGPVLSVIRVKDLQQALEVANGVTFGLSSSIYTRDVSKVFEFIDHIETGITHVNSSTTGGEAQVPFGGIKGTGVGPREQGSGALDFYTELKAVYVDYTGAKRESLVY